MTKDKPKWVRSVSAYTFMTNTKVFGMVMKSYDVNGWSVLYGKQKLKPVNKLSEGKKFIEARYNKSNKTT